MEEEAVAQDVEEENRVREEGGNGENNGVSTSLSLSLSVRWVTVTPGCSV